MKMLIEIATGLCHIHNCRVLHQNLVPHNILVAQDFAMKIAGPICNPYISIFV